MMKNKILLITMLFLLIIITVFLYLKYRRTHERWTENIELINGDKIQIYHHYSQRALYGPLHFLIGGGAARYKVSFEYKKQFYEWENLYIPIVIQFLNDDLYIVMLDYESSDSRFVFYKYKKRLFEIGADGFPKSIAIQNRWTFLDPGFPRLQVPIEEYKINPKNRNFQYSILAKIWVRLELGVRYQKTKYKYIDNKFLHGYKKKYIDAVVAEQNKK